MIQKKKKKNIKIRNLVSCKTFKSLFLNQYKIKSDFDIIPCCEIYFMIDQKIKDTDTKISFMQKFVIKKKTICYANILLLNTIILKVSD